jgi:hypothetical protein
MITIIYNKDIVIGINRQSAEAKRVELSVTTSLRVPHGQERTSTVKQKYTPVTRVGNVDGSF